MGAEDKHLEHLAKLRAIEGDDVNKWYGWGSPIGLSVFFISFTAMVYVFVELVRQFIK